MMFTSEIKVRVRYSETDRMGYVYYGNYATYFEVARVEALRELGITYKEMEDDGILLSVYKYEVKFHKPLFYDDELTIKTFIYSMPEARIIFNYEITNQKRELVNTAQTTLVFIDRKTSKPCYAPQHVIDALKEYF